MARLFLEQDPPSQSVHAGVVGMFMLIFIVLRVTTTRGFAALKPGFNTRAIVTWLICSSLTLLVLYQAILARTLYSESMATYYNAPTKENRELVPANFFPLTVPPLRDMYHNSTWNIDTMADPSGQQFYHIFAMKPSVLYSDDSLYFMDCLRIMLKASQGGLIAGLLLLNTYWCKHVEALVDEGYFMSNFEKYLYFILAGVALVVPVTTLSVLSLGFNNSLQGGNISDLLLLICGATVLVCYIVTCHRLRSLERDSRNVNGEYTSVTLQLSYYVYCIYWLIGSMIFIFSIGIMYRFDDKILKPQCNPVKAQIISDLEGATWSTVLVMVYPAAMFLLYPSVDVLTKPENDPSPRFERRVRRDVKDAKRFRESLYIDGDSGSGINAITPGQHSSLHGLTTSSGLALNAQASNDRSTQQYSYIEPKRRDRMDSLTAVANEMHMIEQANLNIATAKDRTPSPSRSQEPSPDGSKQGSWKGAHADPEVEKSTNKDKAIANNNNNNLPVGLSRRDSNSPSNYYEDSKDVETMKKWLAQNGDLDRDSIIAGLEQTINQQNRSWKFVPPTTTLPKVTTTAATSEIPAVTATTTTDPTNRRPSGEHYAMAATSTTSTTTPSTKTTGGTSNKPAAAPLTGILKTRNSTNSTRSSVGLNPFDQHAASIASIGSTPVYGVRTSSVQHLNQTGVASRKSTENMPVKRRVSNSGASKSNTTVTGSSPIVSSDSPSLSSQQRRSNVTTRMDAGAVAMAAHQHQQQQTQKGRTSRDGIDADYFGIRKSSFDIHPTATTPPPLPYEPQGQNVPPLEMIMSPTMTGFLMADPYPSAGTRYLDSEELHDYSLSSDSHDDTYPEDSSQSGRRSSGSTGASTTVPTSKRYRAPPPPIPVDAANANETLRKSDGGFPDGVPLVPVTPTTPVTPPGVRPRRSVDNVVDKQFLEMANLMYDDHIIPDHILQSARSANSVASVPATASAPSKSATAPKTPTAPLAPPMPPPPSSHSLHTSASSPTFYGPFSTNTSSRAPPPATPPPRPRQEDLPSLFPTPSPSPSSQRQPQQSEQAQPQPVPLTLPQITRHEPQPLFLPELPQRIPITPSPLQRVMTPPAKSPYRMRETFETRLAAHTGSGNTSLATPMSTTATSSVAGGTNTPQIQGPSAPSSPTSTPSIASTTSPTIRSATTLPRPLTPAWYETKTNFASTNDVLNHYNAVTRGGSYHKQQLQQAEEQQSAQHNLFQSSASGMYVPNQQQQQQQLQSQQSYYMQPSVGPLDEVPVAPLETAPSLLNRSRLGFSQQQAPTSQAPNQQNVLSSYYAEPVSTVATSRTQNKQSDSDMPSSFPATQARTPSLEPRTGSTDSFGVYRRRSSSAQQSQIHQRRSKDEIDLPIAAAYQLQMNDPSLYPVPSQRQQQSIPQLDRHSFIMPSESISVYSTWTGDLSDVTNTSGEVSVGAFLDRKHASTLQYSHRKSGEKLGTGSHLSTSSVGTINLALRGSSGSGVGGGGGSGSGGSGGEETRKSQYSMGSFGSRQSAGAFSNYSNHSSSGGSGPVSGPLSEAFGSGPVVVSAPLSSVEQPMGTDVMSSIDLGSTVPMNSMTTVLTTTTTTEK
ncbi:hypothetical protein FBU30_002634 [Linnemannia zychae]|nr:hypothetical protein FBU30_002634 [Linnemannia zychae]